MPTPSIAGPDPLVGQFIITTGATGPEIFEIKASPLPGWYLCRQINEAPIQASVLFRLEEFKNSNTLFFDSMGDAIKALSSVGQRSVGEKLGEAKS